MTNIGNGQNFHLNSMSMNANPNSQISLHLNHYDDDKKQEALHDDMTNMDVNSFIQVTEERIQRKQRDAILRMMKEHS